MRVEGKANCRKSHCDRGKQKSTNIEKITKFSVSEEKNGEIVRYWRKMRGKMKERA